MVNMNITLSVSGELEKLIKKHPEIKWTELARQGMLSEAEKLQKLEILRKFLDRELLNEDDYEWMDKHDWHPVDEQALRPEFVRESLRISKKGKFKKVKKISDLFM